MYEGIFIDGKANGDGTCYYKSIGAEYKGEWKDDERHGIGVLQFKDGAVFQGNWVANKMNFGTLTWPDGSEYTGLWRDFYREGEGTYCNDLYVISG